MGKTSLFSRKQPGGIFTIVDETRQGTGNLWFVDSGSVNGVDSVGAGVNPDAPFLTWAYAVSQCTANNGDTIFLMPGHAETIATATALDINIAGVKTIGLGEGNDRPTFTVNGVATATITFSAASCSAKNIIVVSGLDGLNSAITVTGVGVELDIEHRDTSSTVEADIAITCTGDKFKCKLRDIGFTGGDQRDQSITLNAVDNARIDIDFYGKVGTAIVDMITAACTDVEVKGYFYCSGTTNLSKNVKDTITGSTWFVEGYDGAAGCSFSGGSGATVAKDDLSVIASDVVVIDTVTDTIASDLLLLSASNSDVDVIKSDIKILDPIIDTIKSDLIVADALIDTIKSDLIVADALIDTIKSDIIVIDPLIDTIKSDLIISQSDIKVIDTVTDTIASDLVVADALIDTIKSDVIVMDAIADTIKSDLIVADALIDTIKSDLIVIQPSNPQLVSKAFADMTGFDNTTCFTVTGNVIVQVVGVVGATAIQSTSGTTTLSIGTAASSGGIRAATTIDNAQFAANDVWVDTTPTDDVEALSATSWYVIGGGADIVLSRSVDDITQGVLTLYCWWKALSAGATVVAA